MKINNTTIHEVEQGTPEWMDLRIGKITASKVKAILNIDGKLKAKGPLQTALSKVLAEIETGFSNDSDFMSDAMEWGVEHEFEVIDKYKTDMFAPIGFATNSKFKYLGCSPDMVFYGENAKFEKGIEIKCPNSATHIKWHLDNKIPNEHLHQVLIYFLIFELEKMSFVSYDPRNNKRPYFEKTILKKDIQPLLDQTEESILRFEFLISEHLKK